MTVQGGGEYTLPWAIMVYTLWCRNIKMKMMLFQMYANRLHLRSTKNMQQNNIYTFILSLGLMV